MPFPGDLNHELSHASSFVSETVQPSQSGSSVAVISSCMRVVFSTWMFSVTSGSQSDLNLVQISSCLPGFGMDDCDVIPEWFEFCDCCRHWKVLFNLVLWCKPVVARRVSNPGQIACMGTLLIREDPIALLEKPVRKLVVKAVLHGNWVCLISVFLSRLVTLPKNRQRGIQELCLMPSGSLGESFVQVGLKPVREFRTLCLIPAGSFGWLPPF